MVKVKNESQVGEVDLLEKYGREEERQLKRKKLRRVKETEQAVQV